MGKCYVCAWFRHTCICSSMRGRYKIQIAEGWKWQRIFPNKRVRFARADKAVALQYHNQWSTDTNVCGGFTPGVIVGRWTQAQPGKNTLLQSFLYTTCRTTGRRRTDVVIYWLQNSTTFKLAPPGKRGSLGLEWLEGLLYHTPGTFSQQTLLEALIVTGGSASYFGEQYRDLLLDLYQKLDENNSSNQQVQ